MTYFQLVILKQSSFFNEADVQHGKISLSWVCNNLLTRNSTRFLSFRLPNKHFHSIMCRHHCNLSEIPSVRVELQVLLKVTISTCFCVVCVHLLHTAPEFLLSTPTGNEMHVFPFSKYPSEFLPLCNVNCGFCLEEILENPQLSAATRRHLPQNDSLTVAVSEELKATFGFPSAAVAGSFLLLIPYKNKLFKVVLGLQVIVQV